MRCVRVVITYAPRRPEPNAVALWFLGAEVSSPVPPHYTGSLHMRTCPPLFLSAGYVGGPTMAVIAQNCPNIRVCVVDISVPQIQVRMNGSIDRM